MTQHNSLTVTIFILILGKIKIWNTKYIMNVWPAFTCKTYSNNDKNVICKL